jgi:hypothetical protein
MNQGLACRPAPRAPDLPPRWLAPPLMLVLAAALAGCAAPRAVGLSELLDRPAERALLDGQRAYDDGQYAAAEPALQRALQAGLASPRDRARAHKLIAFITCSSQRVAECEAAFRAARAADPAFVLERAEAGHPLWGPVYRRVLP